jgi:hypothetical protein
LTICKDQIRIITVRVVCRFDKCSGTDTDYLRVLGDRGVADTFYCGDNGVNATYHGGNAVAMLFKANAREEEGVIGGKGRLGLGLEGFSCKIVCRDRTKEATTTTSSTTTLAPPNQASTPSDTLSASATSDASSSTSPPPPCKCGQVREARIVCPSGYNCTTSSAASVPWQAAIVNRGRRQPWCGGTLINGMYVLTAAHCMQRKSALKIQARDSPFFKNKVIILPDWEKQT